MNVVCLFPLLQLMYQTIELVLHQKAQRWHLINLEIANMSQILISLCFNLKLDAIWIFPKCSANSVTKRFVIVVKGLKPATSCVTETRMLLQHCKTHVRDRIFKLTVIHASVIYQMPWIHWILVPFRENTIAMSVLKNYINSVRTRKGEANFKSLIWHNYSAFYI